LRLPQADLDYRYHKLLLSSQVNPIFNRCQITFSRL
jgi:hypothetical protein